MDRSPLTILILLASERARVRVPALYSLPEIAGVEEAREFGIDVDDVDIALARIANDGFGIVPGSVGFDVNSQGAIHFEFESGRGRSAGIPCSSFNRYQQGRS